ncbi:hypothetical protein GCM10023185_35050 [Hymenobacter saemangeumensis]|uniref:M23ase beta-sheet core domain-containing protein n=1 Tax=Hymenobacter saemangeumensis TaxID=1084522 RepID=A0ABP8IPT3_9BACT
MRALLHSYSIIFFSQHRGFATVLLLVTFAHPAAGAAGVLATALALGTARVLGLNREWTDVGAYSFNSLLVGLALSTIYEPSWALGALIGVGSLLALLLSVAMGGWLGGRGLPFLSLPFMAVLWLLLPTAAQLPQLGLSERGIYWLNDLYALGGEPLVTAARWLGEWTWPLLPATYLRALSSVLFLDSVPGGLLVALGLLWHSRIAFSLSLLAFLGAYAFAVLTGTLSAEGGAYNLGANYMMAAIAVGGVFVVPSAMSYALALLSVPVTAVLLGGLSTLLAKAGLPAFSLPFCLSAILFLYVLLLREKPTRGLTLTPFQRYSPEQNLYAFTTDQVRLSHQLYFPLTLPFLGEWHCSQGYADGGPTHRGDWSQALDFVVRDADGCTFRGDGNLLNDFYCYNKPVLAPADGVVEEVVQHIDDNPIGQVNLQQNWGNTIVIRHQPGLYTQLSHLRPHSVPVRPGDPVRRGDVVGYCGSSGRSPEPHLHFQVQATPYIGSRTLAYPLAYYLARKPAAQVSASPPALARSAGLPYAVPEAMPPQTLAWGEVPTAEEEGPAKAEPAAPAAKSRKLPASLKKLVGLARGRWHKPETSQLRHFAVPLLGEALSHPAAHRPLSQALLLPPGYVLHVAAADAAGGGAQTWEVLTDAYNKTYLRCQHSGAVAYFERDEAVFCFTAYYGPETSWLYLLYRAAYRVPLPYLPQAETTDTFPLTVVSSPALKWAQDFVAPFFRFVRPAFSLRWAQGEAGPGSTRALRLHSRATVQYFRREQLLQESELLIQDGALAELRVQLPGRTLHLLCSAAA